MNFPEQSDDLKRVSTCCLGRRADTRFLFDDDRFEKQLDFDLDFGKFEGFWVLYLVERLDAPCPSTCHSCCGACHSWLLRTDAICGFSRDEDGVRVEMRHKF